MNTHNFFCKLSCAAIGFGMSLWFFYELAGSL